MLPQNKPDRIRILFDDHRLVANAGLLLPATLARHLLLGAILRAPVRVMHQSPRGAFGSQRPE